MSYSKNMKTLNAVNNRHKKISNVSKASSGFDEPDEYVNNEIIINVLDENNNNSLNGFNDEDSKPFVTRCLITRSESTTSQPQRKVSNAGMISHFVDCVREMNKVVLLPSLLRDIELNGNESVPSMLDGVDLFSGYQLLNTFKNSLLYTSTTSIASLDNDSPKLMKQQSVNEKREFLKELSVDSGYSSLLQDSATHSMSSRSSVNMEDDNESCNGSDVSDLVSNFYHHLHGLNSELERLIEAAKFITNTYEHSSIVLS